MNEKDILAGFQTELREHLEIHRCPDCTRLYYQALRATNIMLESIGGQHVFPNNGTPIAEMEKPERDSYRREKELHEDTPEIVAAKAKKAMDVGQEALRIFGGKK